MTLSGPTNATLKSDANTATGTINDDDNCRSRERRVVTLTPASGKQVR